MSTVASGLKRVDVGELYDSKEYRPKVRHVLHKLMFLLKRPICGGWLSSRAIRRLSICKILTEA